LEIPRLSQLFRVALLTVFMITAGTTATLADNSSSESVTVSINHDSIPLKDLMNEIEKSTDYLFFYSSDVDVNQNLSVNVSDKSVFELLNEVLKGTNIGYEREGTHIILSVKQPAPATTVAAAPQNDRIAISGTVRDQDGNAIIGATIIEKGSTNGSISDVGGNFSLRAAGDGTLVVSYIGYLEQEVTVNNRSTIDIVMQEDLQILDDVVVVGYGTMSKKDLTGAVSVVNVSDIANRASSNVMQSLQGRVPGVFITSDGSPSGGATVMVRGVNAMGANGNRGPLYIIDGMASTGGMNELSPQDIESIQVLKDASSASIYGSRASNGVIIITTRKGDRQRTTVTGRLSLTARTYVKSLDWLNTEERGRIHWQAARNDGNDPNNSEIYSFEDHQDANGNWILDRVNWAEYIDAPNNTMKSADTDWAKEVGQTSLTQNYNVRVSTGGDKGRSLFALDYLDYVGTVRETFNKRISARMNSDYSLMDGRLTIAENFSLTKTERSRLNAADILSQTRSIQPIVPVHTVDGIGWGGPWGSMADRKNPVRQIEHSKGNNDNILRLFGDASIDLELTKNLHVKSTLGIDYSFLWYRNRFLPFKEGFMQDTTPIVTNRDDRFGNWIWSNTINYDFTIAEDHKFTVLAGQEALEYGFERVEAERKNFADLRPDYMYLDVGETDQRAAGYGTAYSLMSYFGKLNYNYLNRYLFSFTLRYDGSSRFGRNNRFGTFPALSLGWRLSEESFFRDSAIASVVSDLKLRYGWGKTGNQDIGNYATMQLYSAKYASDWAQGGWYFDGTAYDIGGNDSGTLPSGYIRTQLANADLRWEAASQHNIGIDFGLFDNALMGSFDYFVKDISDILVTPPVLAVLGEGSEKATNGAGMKNTGFEFMLSYSKQFGDFDLSVAGNLGAYKNKVTYLPQDVYDAYPGNGIDDVIIGHPVNSYYGYIADGLFQSQAEVDAHADQTGAGVGRLRYRDVNGDDKITIDDRTWIGVRDPDFIYGINVNMIYKQWDFSAFFNGVAGGVANTRGVKLFTDFFGADKTGENNGKRTLDAWTPLNSDSTIPMLSFFDNNNEKEVSSYFMENASYFKLRSLELGYTLPETLTTKLHMTNTRVYLRSENLLKIKSRDFTGIDPETPGTAYPIPFAVSVGLNVSF
jgi:TonB-linked SusC/RagA family outer membrane protein